MHCSLCDAWEALVGFGICVWASSLRFFTQSWDAKWSFYDAFYEQAGCTYGNPAWSNATESWCPSSQEIVKSPSSVFSLSVFQQGCCREHPNTNLWGASIAELERRTKQCHCIDDRITIRPLALLQMRRKLKLPRASKGPGSKTFYPETWIDHRFSW